MSSTRCGALAARRAGRCLPCAAVLAVGARRAVQLEALTSTELRDRIAGGTTTVLVPIGGTEQNGPHMVLGKHNVRVRVLAERIARAARQCAGRAGDGLRARRRDRAAGGAHALRRHDLDPRAGLRGGARRRGAQPPPPRLSRGGVPRRPRRLPEERGARRREAEPRVGRQGATRCRVHALASTTAPRSRAMRTCSRRAASRADEIGQHAGLADTSLALAVDESLVRPRLARPRRPRPRERPGVSGDPRRATVELGRLGVERIVEATVSRDPGAHPRSLTITGDDPHQTECCPCRSSESVSAARGCWPSGGHAGRRRRGHERARSRRCVRGQRALQRPRR